MTLIGYWPLNETDSSDSTAYDYSGRENHGSVTGAGPADTGTVTGPTGQSAYKFDGSDDLIDITGISSLSAYTLSLWAKTTELSTRRRFIAVTQNNGVYIDHKTNGELAYVQAKSGGGDASLNTSVAQNDWSHICGTWDGNTIRLYHDGIETGSASISSMRTDSTSDFIGGDTGDSLYHQGAISEVRVYNHALTPQEVQYLYTAGKQGRLTTHRKKS